MPPAKSKKSTTKPLVKRVPFVVKANGARKVVLTGDFTQWAVDRFPLSPGRDGEWSTQLELPPGEYQYRLIIDGVWSDHAEALRRVSNPFGSENCVLTVS